MIISNTLYSPQSYLEMITGVCYIIEEDSDVDFIRRILKEKGFDLADYEFKDIDKIVKDNTNVVLVDCMNYSEDILAFTTDLHWFEVSDEIMKESELNDR